MEPLKNTVSRVAPLLKAFHLSPVILRINLMFHIKLCQLLQGFFLGGGACGGEGFFKINLLLE